MSRKFSQKDEQKEEFSLPSDLSFVSLTRDSTEHVFDNGFESDIHRSIRLEDRSFKAMSDPSMSVNQPGKQMGWDNTFFGHQNDLGSMDKLSLSGKFNSLSVDDWEVSSPANMASPLEHAPPRSIGNYLEPNHHFITTWNPNEVLKMLIAVLATMRYETVTAKEADADGALQHYIDTDVNENKFKIKATAYTRAGGVRVYFIVRVFSLETAGSYAVEVQRRSGDPMRFCMVYRDIMFNLQERGLVEGDLYSQPTYFMSPLSSDQGRGKQGLQSLVNMLSSSYCDVVVDAIVSLIEFAADPTLHSVLVEMDAVTPIIQLLGSTDAEVHRCAIVGLRHLSRGGEVCAAILQAPDAMDHLMTWSNSPVQQVKREIGHLVCNLVFCEGDKVFDFVDASEKWTRESVRQQLLALSTLDLPTRGFCNYVFEQCGDKLQAAK